jgi:hypothetical protein
MTLQGWKGCLFEVARWVYVLNARIEPMLVPLEKA